MVQWWQWMVAGVYGGNFFFFGNFGSNSGEEVTVEGGCAGIQYTGERKRKKRREEKELNSLY